MKKVLSFFLVAMYCYCIAKTASFGQVIKEDPKNNLPTVSNEVFQSIVQFYEYDRDIPLEARIVAKNELPYGKREKVVFIGINHAQVPAYLVTPKNGASKHPVVLIVDGIYGSKERWFEDNSWPKGGLVTKALVDKGYAVMILDAMYHGERSYENGYVEPPWMYTFPNKFRKMVIQTATEYRRGIDYLATRADIDSTRIGMLGLSIGGLITFQLTSIDSRIKTAIAGVTPFLKGPIFQPVQSYTFANHVGCNSFLMFMGNKDDWYTMEEARQLYDLLPVTHKEFVEYDAGHKPPVEYIVKVTDWFEKYLKP